LCLRLMLPEQVLYHLSQNSGLFFSGVYFLSSLFFWRWGSQTIFTDRPQTMIFPMSASAVVGL
jgi:hypothetical protein